MKIVKWAAVALETLNILMALGSIPSATDPTWLRIGAGVAAVAGFLVIIGLAKRTPWGAPAGVAAGLLSAVGGIAMMATHEKGGEIGLTIGALVAMLCALSLKNATRRPDTSSLSA